MKGKIEDLNIEELDRNLKESKESLRQERFKRVTSTVDNPKKAYNTRKHIARILTLKSEYKLGIRENQNK
jgi:ribosomal protein L29